MLFKIENEGIALASGTLTFIFAAMSFPFLVDISYQVSQNLRDGADQIIGARIKKFSARHPEWHLRIYQTQNGFRLLAMHQIFDPRSQEVADAFRQLAVDRIYAAMCQKQNCFRARLTGKPWRMGFKSDVSLSQGVWPIAESLQPLRSRWVSKYENAATQFSACRFVKAIGAIHAVCSEAKSTCQLHDTACRANDDLPLA